MAEAEESDAIGLNIDLEFSKKNQEELAASLKENEYHPNSHTATTRDTEATDTSTAQEGPTNGGHAYFK